MSENAICISCNPGYSFGLISYMNAQEYFGTDADWEIAYDGFTQEERERISAAFSFNVNWTPVDELMKTVVDRRSDQRGILERFWLAYWLMAEKVLREDKYKAVAVTQADQFTFVNLDMYFKLAQQGNLVSAEFNANRRSALTLPFGDDRAIWDRCLCPIFDNLQIFGQHFKNMPRQIVEYQCEDAFRGESNHSVIALNRAASRYATVERVITLEGSSWSCDADWGFKWWDLDSTGDRIWDYVQRDPEQLGIQIKGWHMRWWQKGRVEGHWLASKGLVDRAKVDPTIRQQVLNMDHNINLTKSFQERFNAMKPEIASTEFHPGPIARPRIEGEE